LPKVWQRFVHLNLNDSFFIGRCQYMKAGFLLAVTPLSPARRIRVWPWTRVQTNVLVRDARPGGKSSYVVDDFPGQTHYVGDDCPGGHADAGRPTPDITGPTS
jgi:hypothetical protein